MLNETLEIRKIKKEELFIIRNFPPEDWNLDLEVVYKQHYDSDYFYPLVALINNEIIATGIAVINDNAAWLGTLIVQDNHRNKGIGNKILLQLIETSLNKGVESIILTASELGLPIYKKMGFESDINYLFFKTDNIVPSFIQSEHITEITEADYNKIFELDFEITGEKRIELLQKFLATGFKYKDAEIEGYYLPDYGKGLIIAKSETAGLELVKFRLMRDTSSICVPDTNLAAIDFLVSIGFYQYFSIPRMYLNKKVTWNSKCIYSRGSGFMG